MTVASIDVVTRRDTGPASSCLALVVGTAVTGSSIGRALLISCTSSGNVVVQFQDGTQATIALPAAGIYEFNWVVNLIVTSGTTATATYYNLF